MNYRWGNRKTNNLEMDLLPQYPFWCHRDGNIVRDMANRRPRQTRVVQIAPIPYPIRLPGLFPTHLRVGTPDPWPSKRRFCGFFLELSPRGLLTRALRLLLAEPYGVDYIQGDTAQAKRSSFTVSFRIAENSASQCSADVSLICQRQVPEIDARQNNSPDGLSAVPGHSINPGEIPGRQQRILPWCRRPLDPAPLCQCCGINGQWSYLRTQKSQFLHASRSQLFVAPRQRSAVDRVRWRAH